MSYHLYGLREARTLIAERRKVLATHHPRSDDPYVRGQRDALKALDDKIKARMEGYKPVNDPPASVRQASSEECAHAPPPDR